MTMLPHQSESRRSVRLDTLMRLRWLAILGQTAALFVVEFVLDYEQPFWTCVSIIVFYAIITATIWFYVADRQRLPSDLAAWILALDIAELAALLALTGGLQNPFAFLLLGPVLISATALPWRTTQALAGLAVICATILVFVHYPLPWTDENPLVLPPTYMIGVWLCILIAIGYISIYAGQFSEEAQQLSEALAATELVLAREFFLTQLDGLAGAAAHELGTPLSTIAVVSKELQHALAGTPYAEDAKVVREQVRLCREILGKLTELPAPGEPYVRMTLSTLLDEVAAPYRDFGTAIEMNIAAGADEPVTGRDPAIIYGLSNLLENAVDFARARVEVSAYWNEADVGVTIRDDGPGFPPEILARIGEPYVQGPRPRERPAPVKDAGLGLGSFIAKTLLERSGAKITFANAQPSGAKVTVKWNRAAFRQKIPSTDLSPEMSIKDSLKTYTI